MRYLMLAVCGCIAVMMVGCIDTPVQDFLHGEQAREGVIDEISDMDDWGLISCNMNGHYPINMGIVTIMSSPRYAYGEEGWVAVFIKPSRGLSIRNISKKILVDVPDEIELIEAVDSEFLPYEHKNSGGVSISPRYKQHFHVPLNENYFVLIRF